MSSIDPVDPLQLRQGFEIPFSESVRRRGKVQKPEEDQQVPTGIGWLDAIGTEFHQNSLLMHGWRAARLWQLGSKEAPAGWIPQLEIKGIFRDYEEYLSQARNPEEMAYRKDIVLQQMNYQIKMSRAGFMKRGISSLTACALDPVTYVFGGVFGKVAGGVISKGAAAAGLGNIATGAIHGAAFGAALNLAEVPLKRALGATPENPEYHVVAAALGGAAFGTLAGVLSDAAGLSRFRIEHGRDWAKNAGDYAVFKEANLAQRRQSAGIGEFASTPEKQIEFHQLLNSEVNAYLKGETSTMEFRTINLDRLPGSREEAVAEAMGWRKKLSTGKVVDLTSRGIDRLRGVFSNAGQLLTSPDDMMAATGMKVFATNYYSDRLARLVGDKVPLQQFVEKGLTSSSYRLSKAMKNHWNMAKAEGFQGRQDEFFSRVSSVAHGGKAALEQETSAAVRSMYNELEGILFDAASELHKRGGFQSQIDLRESYANEKAALEKRLKRQTEGTEAYAELSDELARLDADFKAAYSNLSLENARERLGGTFFPQRFNASMVAENYSQAQSDFTQSYMTAEGGRNSAALRDQAQELMDLTMAEVQRKEAATKGGKYSDDERVSRIWNEFNRQAKRRNLRVKDMYESPLDAGIRESELVERLSRGEMEYSKLFIAEAEAYGQQRVRGIVDGLFAVNQPAPTQGVTFRGLANEGPIPEIKAHGSAKRRTHFDDYEIVGKYLETDLMKVVQPYLRNMIGSSGMIDAFGDVHGTSWVNELWRSAKTRQEAALKGGSLREAQAIEQRFDRDLKAFQTSIDQIRGYSSVDWGSIGERSSIRRGINTVANLNVARFLSDSVFAQLQDMANVALKMDGWRTIGRSFANMVKTLFSPKLRKEFGTQIYEYGVGGTLFMDSMRAKPLIEVAENAGRSLGERLEAGSGFLARKAMKFSGTELFDAFTQNNASYMATNELARMGEALSKGKRFSAFQERFTADYKLSSAELRGMHEQIGKFSSRDGDIFSINLSQWSNQQLADRVRLIMHDVGTKATMVPGAELPAYFKTPLGKMLLQFKSFTTGTFSRMFLPSLERGTFQFNDTLMQCMMLDYMAKVCKAFGKPGSPQKKDPVTGEYREDAPMDSLFRLFQDTIKQTDLTAWATDPTGVIPSLMSNGDFRPNFGGTFASTSGDLVAAGRYVAKALNGEKYTDAQMRSAWRLLPFQNHFLMRCGVAAYKSGKKRLTKDNLQEIVQ